MYHFTKFLLVLKQNLGELDGVEESDFDRSQWIDSSMASMTMNSKERYETAIKHLLSDIEAVYATKINDTNVTELVDEEYLENGSDPPVTTV